MRAGPCRFVQAVRDVSELDEDSVDTNENTHHIVDQMLQRIEGVFGLWRSHGGDGWSQREVGGSDTPNE
jgi:hypothetical protein